MIFTNSNFKKMGIVVLLFCSSFSLTQGQKLNKEFPIPYPPEVHFLYEMQDQWHKQFWIFRSQDSGANVIWDSVKDANGWTDYDVNHNDTDHAQVGITCIRMDAKHPPSGKWIGWHYLYPSGNWNGTLPGYDLSECETLSFQAKADTAGIQVKFRVRTKDTAGGLYLIYPEEAHPTSNYLTLTQDYQTYHFDFKSLPADALYNVFEPFSIIIQDYVNNPTEYTIYLDDIRYDLNWKEDPHLLDSLVPVDIGMDYSHMNQAQVYDNDLVGLTLLSTKTPEGKRRAGEIAESLLFAMEHSPNAVVKLFNAYRSGMLYERYSGHAAFPGFWNYDSEKWILDENAINSDTGNNCWTIIFLLEVYKQFKGTTLGDEALAAAQDLGDFLLTYLKKTDGDGFLLRMLPSVEGDPSSTYVKFDNNTRSTEMNIDAMVAFHRLYLVDGQSKWEAASLSAYNFIYSMIDSVEGVIYTGTDENGQTVKNVIAEDVQSWMILATVDIYGPTHPPYAQWISYVENTMLHEPTHECPYYGFDFSDSDPGGPDAVWFEGTAHMVLAYDVLKMYSKSLFFLDQIKLAQTLEGKHFEFPLWLGRGIPAACRDELTTGFDWFYYHRLSLAPTAWYIMAKSSYNPFTALWSP